MNALATKSTSATTGTTGSAQAATPGKQTASAGLPSGQASATKSPTGALTGGPLPPALVAHIGETFVDGGSYVWRLESDGAFKCVAQPPSATASSVGARVTQAARDELWVTLCAIAIEALAPEAKPETGTAPAEGAEEDVTNDGGGFSLEGFLAGLFATGSTLVDVGSQVADLVTDTIDAVTGAIGSLLGVSGDGTAEPVEAPAPKPSEGGGSDEDVRDEEGGAAPDAPAANPATPYIVGGYPSSKQAGGKPAYSGAEVNDDAGIPKNHGGVHLTPAIVRTAKILAEYMPAGTVITSGWRTDEDQAYIIWDYAGRAAGQGKHNGMLVDNDLWKTKPKAEEYNNPIAWVGESDHRSGLAMDLAGASLSLIQAAVEKCKEERPDAKIRYIKPEPKCIHVAVDE